ncbi:MAG TPA: aminotransferase class V-fold PLP-dependent enzyme [Mycobacteriales bacterium]|nr:aminotransferase class V-fold PLP-dependent enzyme [Mycobacteriales bacterium]
MSGRDTPRWPHLRTHRARHLADTLDVGRVRSHFDFPGLGRTVTNNAATTQPPRELPALLAALTRRYENVHRGQSAASQQMTELFEMSYDTFAQWLNATSRRTIATYRNTTEAINAVMYSLLTDFRDGDNVVTTMLEHNSNFVPWYGMSREILPRFGRHVECRIARFNHLTGELDMDHLAGLVDARTKLVCVTGASNFLGTKPPLPLVRAIANDSGYPRDDGGSGSLMLVDAAQLVPSGHVDVQRLDVDYLAFSCHKVLAPFGVGVLYAKERLLARARPFLYGGDMIAEGRVAPDLVEYNDLPWKYAAGTPNILGVIVSAQALRLMLDLVGVDSSTRWFTSTASLPVPLVAETMDRVGRHTAELTDLALCEATTVDGLRLYGPAAGLPRSPLVAFNVAGVSATWSTGEGPRLGWWAWLLGIASLVSRFPRHPDLPARPVALGEDATPPRPPGVVTQRSAGVHRRQPGWTPSVHQWFGWFGVGSGQGEAEVAEFALRRVEEGGRAVAAGQRAQCDRAVVPGATAVARCRVDGGGEHVADHADVEVHRQVDPGDAPAGDAGRGATLAQPLTHEWRADRRDRGSVVDPAGTVAARVGDQALVRPWRDAGHDAPAHWRPGATEVGAVTRGQDHQLAGAADVEADRAAHLAVVDRVAAQHEFLRGVRGVFDPHLRPEPSRRGQQRARSCGRGGVGDGHHHLVAGRVDSPGRVLDPAEPVQGVLGGG